VDGGNGAGDAAAQVVEHLHRFYHDDDVAFLHLVAGFDTDLGHDAGKGRDLVPLAVDEALGLLLTAGGAAARRLDLIGTACDLQIEGLLPLRDQDLEDAVVQRQDVAG
jgi:hypothetical protein